MPHTHLIVDMDRYFSIDPYTRVMTHESESSLTLIQYDHNSERYTFELPRYVEGHDMLNCNQVRVHYMNISANGKERNNDVYEVVDLQLDPEDENYVLCTWLISQNATQLIGSLSFLIHYACVIEGKIHYSWHTAIFSGIKVGEGLDNTDCVIDRYSDILERWKTDLIDAGIFAADLAAREAADRVAANINAAISNMTGSVKLLASQWVDNTQTISIDGVKADNGLFFSPATREDREVASTSGLFVSATDNTVTFTVDEAPTEDINLSYFVVRVECDSEVST